MTSRHHPSSIAHTWSPPWLIVVRIALVGMLVLAFAAGAPIHTAAMTHVVTTLADSGKGSLRQAILDANASVGIEDTITFQDGLSGTITLTSGQLTIDDDLTIDGPGADVLAISGNHASRVLRVSTGVTAWIDGLTIRNGSATSGFGSETIGGGIYNSGMLTITGSTITGNAALAGGGIASPFHETTLTIRDSAVSQNVAENFAGIYSGGTSLIETATVSGNRSPRYSGGIANFGTMTVTNSSVIGNSSGLYGGGIQNDDNGLLTLENSTVSGNSSLFGGGIINRFFSISLTVRNSTISGNSADQGGGFYNLNQGTVILENSTFSGNSALQGGGIFTEFHPNEEWFDPGTLLMTNVTISRNIADTGGGIFNSGDTEIRLNATIVADNASGWDCVGDAVITDGYNLDSDGTCFTAGGTDIVGVDPQLGGLADNGGQTRTHLPRLDSPSIDTAGAAPCSSSVDQRGVDRPQGVACDIGAVEVVAELTYPFTGFFSPVRNVPMVNTTRAGSAVPMKFSLGGDRGLTILVAGSPSSQRVTCDDHTIVGAIEQSVTAGMSGLAYDTATDTYRYVWKTNRSWAGTCRIFSIVLTDGTTHHALFKFT